MCTIIALPGLKPSLRSYGAGEIRWPFLFTGIAFAGRLTRTPVADVLSALVNRLLGNGSRQGVLLNGWQSAAGGGELAAPAVDVRNIPAAPAAVKLVASRTI